MPETVGLMCVAIILHGAFEDWPLFVAANRDEDRARPSAPPAIHEPADGPALRLLCPTDLQAGGTWIGVNDRGLVVLLTNRSDLPVPAVGGRSRGHLARTLLACPDLATARAQLLGAAREVHAPYHLILARPGEGIRAFVHRGATSVRQDHRPASRLLEIDGAVSGGEGHDAGDDGARDSQARLPLRHRSRQTLIVSDRGDLADAADPPVVARARELWPRLLAAEGDPWRAARCLLRDRGPGSPEQAICRPGGARGTVSSSIIGVGPDRARFDHAAGPPTTTSFVTQELELFRGTPS